jgi:hypothetical protein
MADVISFDRRQAWQLVTLLDLLNEHVESALECEQIGEDPVLPRYTTREIAERHRRERRLRWLSETFLIQLSDALDGDPAPVSRDLLLGEIAQLREAGA